MTRSTVAGGVGSQRFRARKIAPKNALPIFREKEIEAEAAADGHKVETGVEATEEEEHHLQAAIASQAAAAGGKVAQIYIPTPETVRASVKYEDLYPSSFSQPATYIRFSSTVEDCCGCPYNLSEEDDVFLKTLNELPSAKADASTHCTEDQFEEVMYFFEETAKSQQPFSGVGESPVLAWGDVEPVFEDSPDVPARHLAREIFGHWSKHRKQNGNNPLQPALKLRVIEGTNDADDNDPYVCFRRREVRTTRKTRGRDAQSADKLKKLRKELEEARHIIALVRSRESTKIEQLLLDKQLFEQRASLRQVKRNLPDQYKEGDEDLLISQKAPRKKPLEVITNQRTPTAQMRLPTRLDGRPSDSELLQYKDILTEKENRINMEIQHKMAQHRKWNEHHIDMTRYPVTPEPEEMTHHGFRAATAQYLPTPPPSASDAGSPPRMDERTGNLDSPTLLRYSDAAGDESQQQICYRRRRGRGGRLIIDRRGFRAPSTEGLDAKLIELHKYDCDGGDDDDDDDFNEPDTIAIDPHDILHMRYRANIAVTAQSQHQQVQAIAARRAQAADSAHAPGDSGGHSQPPAAAAPPSAA